jgi:RNA-directed DNA polymerase
VNTDELEYVLFKAERRVLEIQTKLHRWAGEDPARRFDDLYNLVCDPAFLLVGWIRVRSNKGARTAGVDGETAYYIETVRGVEEFLAELRTDLKARTFHPLPARRRAIPKASGKVRYLGSRPSATGWSRPPSNWCWSRSLRWTFFRAPTGSAPIDGLTTRWPRCVT